MLKAFNFIVIRPPKWHIIMYSSFPTFLDCGIDIMWRDYEVIIAEFLTEPTGEPTGNRKVERIHSVNSFQCLNRRFKKSVKKLPKTNRSRIVLSESDDSKQERILLFLTDGNGVFRGGARASPLFLDQTEARPLILRSEWQRPLPPLSEVWIRLWMVWPKKEPTHWAAWQLQR